MLISVLFADVLFLLLGVTSTSRAALISVLFADLLFLHLGGTRAVGGLLSAPPFFPSSPS